MSARQYPRHEHFGPYRQLAPAFEGGQAHIYRGEKDGRWFALKFTRRGGPLASPARLEWEGRIGAALRHRNLATVEEVGTHEGLSFVAFEWVDGASLWELLVAAHRSGSPVGWQELAFVLSELLGVLHYVHQLGLAHLDVSTDNVLVRLDGVPVLIDFGIAAIGGGPPTAAGKPPYTAPEVAHGGGAAPSDQYSLGVLAAELSGAVVEAGGPVTLTATVPLPLRVVIARMTETDPTARHASCAHALRRVRKAAGWWALRQGRRALRARAFAASPLSARSRARQAALASARRKAAAIAIVALAAAVVVAAFL